MTKFKFLNADDFFNNLLTIILFFILIFLLVFSVLFGKINLIELLLSDKSNDVKELIRVLILEIRLPRTILALIAGFSLGICGAAMQGLFRNPLADPSIIGVTSSAGLGSVIIFYFGLANIFFFALPLGGIIGAIIAVMVIFFIIQSNVSTLVIILTGVAISSFSSALTSLTLNLSPSPYAAYEIMFWLLGSLADKNLNHVLMITPITVLGWIIIIFSKKWFTALSLGEETAQSMGLDLRIFRSKIIIGSALSIGSVVSITGGIGFIGLVVPHLLRPLYNYNPEKLLLPSGIGGAIMLLLADIFIRLLDINPELQIGVVTAIIGAPFFIYLIFYIKRIQA
ncbi:MAG: Hemin transport system permease protein HmuU [Alphaproteobacteria bacterium MarineAlpha2_Bin1]|nr:MAG: Hemin transport system permease protein HmuU [Alphaproteobacteria bacterium MarineAlpha2_Bin1]